MKKVLKFSGICAAVLVLVAFILQLASSSIHISTDFFGYTISGDVSGTAGTFGSGNASATWSAIIAFVLLIVSFVIFVCGAVLPLANVHTLDKVLGILNLVAVVCAILAGIFLFIEVPCYAGANGFNTTDGMGLGVGWVFAGILSILGGVVGILPAVFDFIGSKK